MHDDHHDEEEDNHTPVSQLSLWMETRGAHQCSDLLDAMTDAVYDVTRFRQRRKEYLGVVPNIGDTEYWNSKTIAQDRLHFCPYCGKKIKAVAAPKKLRGTTDIPDTLPKDL